MMKKTLCFALMLCLLAVSAQAFTLTGRESETVTREWETNAFFPRMEALTGIAVSAHGVNDEDAYVKLLDGMLGGDIPADALFKANLTRPREEALLAAGAIIDLAPLIEANMPNLSALLAAHPEWRETITLPDGRIPSLPFINETERRPAVYINRAWIETLGMEMPTDLKSLTAVLTAMRDRDPNGNGSSDETPIDMLGVWELRFLLGWFGIVADDYNIAVGEDGELVFAPDLPGYADFLAMLRDWYVNGLLSRDAFTNTHGSVAIANSGSSSKKEEATSGMLLSVTPFTHVPASALDQYDTLLLPGPDGRTVWRDVVGDVWTGCFAVTRACKDPAQALRWADALYGEDGAKLAYAGVEGEDFAYAEDGTWNFLVDDFYTINDVRARSLIYTGTPTPARAPIEFLQQVDSPIDSHLTAQNERVRAVATRPTVPYALHGEALERAVALNATLGRMVDEGIARFVTGETPLNDETLAAWRESLHQAGSEQLRQIVSGK